MSEQRDMFGEAQKEIMQLRQTVTELEMKLEELTESVRCRFDKMDAQNLVMARNIESPPKKAKTAAFSQRPRRPAR